MACRAGLGRCHVATSLIGDLKVLYHLVLKPVRGEDHAERLESFYGGQAGDYDDFRRRLLQGREDLFRSIQIPRGGTWIDLGGGTGSNMEYLAGQMPDLRQATVVDLSASLLKVAQQRFQSRGWTNVGTQLADATTYRPDEPADVVTFSYSLTMIPDWFAAIENAWRMLKPGGTIGIVDFYVSRKHPAVGYTQHRWSTRNFWPFWFGNDNVFPSPDHLPYIQQRFETQELFERRAKIPYLPLVRAPYYIFVGKKHV